MNCLTASLLRRCLSLTHHPSAKFSSAPRWLSEACVVRETDGRSLSSTTSSAGTTSAPAVGDAAYDPGWSTDLLSDRREAGAVRSAVGTERHRAADAEPLVSGHSSVLLFPGQGCQSPGMSRHLSRGGAVAELFAEASEVVGWDVRRLCDEGSAEELACTRVQQPAVVACSAAALVQLLEQSPHLLVRRRGSPASSAALHATESDYEDEDGGDGDGGGGDGGEARVGAVAGYSLGELTALWAAGVLSWKDTMRLAAARGAAMQLAVEQCQPRSGMMTVFVGADSLLADGCRLAEQWCCSQLSIERPVCVVASYLAPGCRVLSGHLPALGFIGDRSRLLQLRHHQLLPVAGGFHSSLMEPARAPFVEALRTVTLRRPVWPLLLNSCGTPVSSPGQIRYHLLHQLTRPVRWEQIMHRIYHRPADHLQPVTYECGPGTALRSILFRINKKAAKRSRSVF